MKGSSTVGAPAGGSGGVLVNHRPFVPTSKLSIPRPAGVRVPRPGVVERIERASQRLGMVVAPAGSGKTAVLAEWATTTDAGVAWLACDQADEEPSQFWSGLIAADQITMARGGR